MRIVTTENGDTIVEVLFAVVVFGLVAIGGLSLMSQGTALAQRALEIGLVRQQIDAQADALRYLNRAYIGDYGKNGAPTAAWKQVAEARAVPEAADFNTIADKDSCNLPDQSSMFALDLTKLNSNPLLVPTDDTATFSQVRYEGTTVRAEGIWIQAIRWPDRMTDSDDDPKDNSLKRPGYYDFHIRACWSSPGQTRPITLGTIVRLYEPRG